MLEIICRRSAANAARRRLFLFLLVLPLALFGFGGQGHTLTWMIAQENLTPEARAMADKLLVGLDDQAVSTWADSIRPMREHTSPWHYINFAWELNRPTVEDLTGKPCLYTAMRDNAQILRDTTKSDEERREAMLFLIHFIGDLHQPLHCGLASDRGGNNIQVTLRGNGTNLHRIWDTEMVTHRVAPTVPLPLHAKNLINSIVAEDRAEMMTRLNPVDWMEESRELMRTVGYHEKQSGPDPELTDSYIETGSIVTERQLILSGHRMAAVLNKIAAGEEWPGPLSEAEIDPATTEGNVSSAASAAGIPVLIVPTTTDVPTSPSTMTANETPYQP